MKEGYIMKRLHKSFEIEEANLTAYGYDCQCNHLPCPCNDMRAQDGPMVTATKATFDEIDEMEDKSWNN